MFKVYFRLILVHLRFGLARDQAAALRGDRVFGKSQNQ